MTTFQLILLKKYQDGPEPSWSEEKDSHIKYQNFKIKGFFYDDKDDDNNDVVMKKQSKYFKKRNNWDSSV